MKDQGALQIGDWVRASTGPAHPRPITGKVIGEYNHPTGGWQWVILTLKGTQEMWHKSHCTKITKEYVSKPKKKKKALAPEPKPKIYGNDDLD